MLISPNNKTKNVVIDIEPSNNTMLVLLTSIFNRLDVIAAKFFVGSNPTKPILFLL